MANKPLIDAELIRLATAIPAIQGVSLLDANRWDTTAHARRHDFEDPEQRFLAKGADVVRWGSNLVEELQLGDNPYALAMGPRGTVILYSIGNSWAKILFVMVDPGASLDRVLAAVKSSCEIIQTLLVNP